MIRFHFNNKEIIYNIPLEDLFLIIASGSGYVSKFY